MKQYRYHLLVLLSQQQRWCLYCFIFLALTIHSSPRKQHSYYSCSRAARIFPVASSQFTIRPVKWYQLYQLLDLLRLQLKTKVETIEQAANTVLVATNHLVNTQQQLQTITQSIVLLQNRVDEIELTLDEFGNDISGINAQLSSLMSAVNEIKALLMALPLP